MAIYSNRGYVSHGIKHYKISDKSKLKEIQIAQAAPGSTAFVIEDSTYYMLNSKKQWIAITPCGKRSPADNPNEEQIYDGGDIDSAIQEEYIYYDGGSIDE